jgi:GTP-binding protein
MPPTNLDLRLSEWLAKLKMPRMIVATKSDKLSNNQRSESIRVLADSFGVQSVVMSSAETGAGCKEIWKQILQATAVKESTRE